MTSVAPDKRAPKITPQLTGQAQVTVKTVCLSVLTPEFDFTKQIEELERKLGCNHVRLLHNNVASIF